MPTPTLCNTPSVSFKLAGREYTITRAQLGQYLILERIRRTELTPETVQEYLHQCGLPTEAPGIEMLQAYYLLVTNNHITLAAPLYRPRASETGGKQPWEYDLRWLFSWVHQIAQTYGWERETILQLDIDEAAGYLQEILVSAQLAHEWQYSLSPNAYSYDKDQNQNVFRPLERPTWMLPETILRPDQPAPALGEVPPGTVIDYSTWSKQSNSSDS